jgi:hypothetical protein
MAERYVRVAVQNNRQGWGVAAFVCLLAIAAAFGAWTIHKRTYQHPRTPINTLQQHGAVTSPAAPVG